MVFVKQITVMAPKRFFRFFVKLGLAWPSSYWITSFLKLRMLLKSIQLPGSLSSFILAFIKLIEAFWTITQLFRLITMNEEVDSISGLSQFCFAIFLEISIWKFSCITHLIWHIFCRATCFLLFQNMST